MFSAPVVPWLFLSNVKVNMSDPGVLLCSVLVIMNVGYYLKTFSAQKFRHYAIVLSVVRN
jgi:hypothetical protein